MALIYINGDWHECVDIYPTVYEPEEIQYTQVLDSNGKPYAIKRQKFKLGFDTTPSKR